MSLALAGALLAGATGPGERVSVTVTGLRNGNGQVLACLTANPASFPDCRADPTARKLVAAAAAAAPAAGQAPGTGPRRAAPREGAVTLDFGQLPPGTYAISLFHDENRNGKLDKVMMMPREGFGFSRDAKVRFGPPRFVAAAFAVSTTPVHQAIRMRYMF